MAKKSIRAAHARSATQFCIAIHSMDDEEPFSIILTYDANDTHIWHRYDVNRNIYDIAGIESAYAALTNNGEVYYIEPGSTPIYEPIKGAGRNAKHSEGRGATISIASVDNTLFVTGFGNQLFQREKKKAWQLIELPKLEAEKKIDDIDLFPISGSSLDNLFVAGKANGIEVKGRADLLVKASRASKSGDKVLAKKIRGQFFDSAPVNPRVTLHFNGQEWTEVDLDEANVKAIYVESRERVFLGTEKNGIFVGSEDEGYDDIETARNVRSITKLGEQVVFIAGSALYTYQDKDSLSVEVRPLKPKAPKGSAPVPLKVQTVGDNVIVFDFNIGVYMWDGDETWSQIDIPPKYMEREYKG